jgi:ATP-dependent Clp protease ATP-binding subunit ClpC
VFEFTKKARKVLEVFAQAEGRRLNSDSLGPEHILLGILKDFESMALKILNKLGVNFDVLKKNIDDHLVSDSRSIILGNIPVNSKFNKVVDIAKEEARKNNSPKVGTEHLLCALFKDPVSIGVDGLIKAGIDYSLVKSECLKLNVYSGNDTMHKGDVKVKTTILDEYTRDLTALARDNQLDPVIGREDEITRLIRILGRKNKNNPVLIGEAGVGKTAIVEGLAQRVVAEDLPESLYEKRILALDMTSIVAGTKYRGEFEERLKRITREIINSENVIIFIDELHTIMGAGAAEGAIDAANILKPFLARGKIQCIGATTFKEYKQHIEKDAALERRFQTIVVNEPTLEQTIKILQGLKESYEIHHKVNYKDSSLNLAVKLSDRYMHDRFLPDKAIDIIDEAGSQARLDNSSCPEEISAMKDEINTLNKAKNELVQGQEYEKAASIRDEIRLKRDILDIKSNNWLNKTNEYEITVDENVILSVVAQSIGIPIEKLEEHESEKLIKMEEYLHNKIIGQDNAVRVVSQAIRRSRTGLKNRNRPIGTFLFAGKTGIGKTKLAKVLSEFLFDSEDALIRIDMSEYMERHAISKLIGAPPGYVGYDEGGQLTQKVKKKPYSVILFDEIEKAHNDFYNILLQVFEEGELTDNNGAKVSFRDTIIIMTSNIGNTRFDNVKQLGFAEDDEHTLNNMNRLMDEVKKSFNPEFVNRIDEVVYFHNLEKSHIKQIVSLMLDELNLQLADREIQLDFSKSLKNYLVEKGYDVDYGARKLKRVIQSEIEDALALEILNGHLKDISKVKVSVRAGAVIFKEMDTSAGKESKVKAKLS